jgi:hypothetical protein
MSDIIRQTSDTSTPAIASDATALAANSARIGFSIQNLGTNALFVRLGASASTSLFHFVLKAGSGNDDGNGGLLTMTEGVIYTGVVTIAGTSPRYTVLEIAP